ncbi:MAG: RsmB/NOP family class I SAM-dependent RNA methyltransferase [Bacteroidota bacterium]
MPKFYAAQVAAIAKALDRIFREGQYADRVIAQVLKEDKRRGSRDRAFIAQQTYEVVRYYRRLTHLAGEEPKQEKDWWRIIGIQLLLAGNELPNWKEFAGLNAEDVHNSLAAVRQKRSIYESLPEWLDELGYTELKTDWPATLTALNQPASVILRANRLKATPQKVQLLLKEAGIETELIGGDALKITERKNLFKTKVFQDGLFEVQDFSSQQAAPALDVLPGMTVIDACAGAGGKSLHLSALMENRGTIIAMDTAEWKLKELRVRARRNGVQNLETRPITGTKIIKRLHGRADRLLLDVPCSGIGVLRRNPDSKWKLSPEFIERLKEVQADILSRYPKMVKLGGKMVYATCSVLPSENEQQLAKFLDSPAGENWQLVAHQTFLPQKDGYDGFFVSQLEKVD